MAIGIIGIGYHTAHLVRGGKHLPVGIVGVRNAGAISISSLCYTAQSIVFLRSDAAQCVSEGTGLVQGIILRRGLVSLPAVEADDCITPQRVVSLLNELCGDDTILACDASFSCGWAGSFFDVYGARRTILPRGMN